MGGGSHVTRPSGSCVNSGKQNIAYVGQQVILRQLSAGQEELEEASSVTLCFLRWLA